MKTLALINIEDEIIVNKEYEVEDSENGYIVVNELGETKTYDRLSFGVLPIDV